MSFKIERIWAFVAQEPSDDEGIIAERVGGIWVPFIAADESRLASLKSRVKELPTKPGTTIKLVRFDVRTDVEVIAWGDA